MNWFTAHTPLIIGHRGASADAPENTLAAFALARAQGADGIELDVQLSADGRLMVFHDTRVDRTTNGRGRVSEMPASALQALDAGQGQPIPTLDEVFALLGADFLYNVEIKDWGWRDRGTETAVAACIHQHNLDQQVLVSSFNPLALRRIRPRLTRSTPLALIREGGWLRYGYLLASGQADHPHHSLVDAAYMAQAARRGWRVHVWTVDDPAEARRLAQLGVHGIITNRPGFIRTALERAA
ncbi:MAG: hypothetical protein KC425_09245 [Anaerolineales bacterium]|nr:hypothetical protein [Anaerolineales bacterium]